MRLSILRIINNYEENLASTIMIRNRLTFLFLIGTNLLFSQKKDCDCLNELDNISLLIKNAKSYTTQIEKADRELDFKIWKEEIKSEIVSDSLSKFFCVGYLQKYISFINDRHNEIYFVPHNISSSAPTYTKAIDTTLNFNDKISGVYYAGNDKILVNKENDSIWYGITLTSNSDDWTKGKIRLRIKKTKNDTFELFEFYKNGLLYYQKNINISNDRISSTFWNKQDKYFFNKNQKQNFAYHQINPSFDYIGIKTLQRTNSLIKEAEKFYGSTLNKLKKENLIIDLRNNGGGSINQAQSLLKSLNRNTAIQHIFVLINFKTASAAELTALQLKEDHRTILLGENSRGMLEYGYGNRAFSTQTNCSEYKVVLSTKHNKSNFSDYEYVGIDPDFKLNNDTDWIDQVLKMKSSKK